MCVGGVGHGVGGCLCVVCWCMWVHVGACACVCVNRPAATPAYTPPSLLDCTRPEAATPHSLHLLSPSAQDDFNVTLDEDQPVSARTSGAGSLGSALSGAGSGTPSAYRYVRPGGTAPSPVVPGLGPAPARPPGALLAACGKTDGVGLPLRDQDGRNPKDQAG